VAGLTAAGVVGTLRGVVAGLRGAEGLATASFDPRRKQTTARGRPRNLHVLLGFQSSKCARKWAGCLTAFSANRKLAKVRGLDGLLAGKDLAAEYLAAHPAEAVETGKGEP